MFHQRIRNTLELPDTYDEDRFPKVEEVDYPETDEEEEDEEPKPKPRKISDEIKELKKDLVRRKKTSRALQRKAA